jgi:hypothetical protein
MQLTARIAQELKARAQGSKRSDLEISAGQRAEIHLLTCRVPRLLDIRTSDFLPHGSDRTVPRSFRMGVAAYVRDKNNSFERIRAGR